MKTENQQTMFKTQVVNSRNIRRTKAFKITITIFVIMLIMMALLSSGIFVLTPELRDFLQKNHESIIRPVAILLIILAAGLSIFIKSRMKNPIFIGNIELDDKGYRFIVDGKVEYACEWAKTRFVKFEFLSEARFKNPLGCQNYLTIVDNQGIRTYEIIIENSLIKANLGEMLRLINNKVPVKVDYTIPLKNIFKDNDLKLY